MQPMPAAIPARTERQAMDWSLVLISEGIETVIDRDPETQVWRLLVSVPDYPRAMGVIRQYRAENRPVLWQQELPWSGLVFDWRCLVPIAFFVFLFVSEAGGRVHLSQAGMMDNEKVDAGEWWRLFTAVTLHADLPHLVANATTGLLLIGLAMGAFGPGTALLATFLSGAGGNLAGWFFYPALHRGLGASGMVMGALGLLTAQWVALLKHGLTPRQLAIRGVFSGVLLLVLLGFSPQQNVDVLAHVAGFLFGLLLGIALALNGGRFRNRAWLDAVALVIWFGLGSFTWWLALRAFRPV